MHFVQDNSLERKKVKGGGMSILTSTLTPMSEANLLPL